MNTRSDVETLRYGTWNTGSSGLPRFGLVVKDDEATDAPFRHLIGTGRVSAIADRWGNVNLFTTEGGLLRLNPPDSSRARGSIYLMMEVEGELISLNSGLGCRAFAPVVKIARQRGEVAFADEVETCLRDLRSAVEATFDQAWFLRGYTDQAKPVGSYAESRVFLEAQTWTVLGKCGTGEQRRSTMRSTIKHCHSDIGLLLMSRPYSSPATGDIFWCAIPAGEGENAEVWPRTIHWFVWALVEERLLEEALAEWKCGTLRARALRFPEVPCGTFNGPDCFSSRWSGKREGWAQSQLLNRAQSIPTNPMIAWQGFTLKKINQAFQERAIQG